MTSTSRRSFLKAGTAAALAAALIPEDAFASSKGKNIIALQLYSIREVMLKNPMGSLTEVAKIGYKYVEHANYIDRKFYGYGAKEFRRILDDLGLKMISGHTVMGKQHWDNEKQDFTDSWKNTIEDAAILGQKYVVSPWMDESMRKTVDDLKHYLEIFNKCGALCAKNGMKFGYHNHDFEFSQVLGDEKVFDIMMKHIDPKLVALQLDIGNLYNGGAKAIDVLKQYPGRFENIHVKDEIKSATGEGHYESTILGKGIVSAKETVELARDLGGAKVFVIEQEAYQGKVPMDCVKDDLNIMIRWGF